MNRWQISAWNERRDAVEVSVPRGADGRYIRRILGNAKDRGLVVEHDTNVMLHSDGRYYTVAYLRGYDAQEIANECIAEQALLPILTSEDEARTIAKH